MRALHPWEDFLRARARCIDWLRIEEKATWERIASDLSCDVPQVEGIFNRDRSHDSDAD